MDKLAKMCMYTHSSVERMADKFYEELRRKVYITPKSYLDGIHLYQEQLEKKRGEFNESITRLSTGLKTLAMTNEQVADLSEQIKKMEPELKQECEQAEVEKVKIEKESEAAKGQEMIVAEETRIVEAQSDVIQRKQEKVQQKLDLATPALLEAEDAVNCIQPNDITNLKKMLMPPKALVLVMKCVTVLLDNPKKEWEDILKWSVKLKLSDLTDKLKVCEKIPEKTLRAARVFLKDKKWDIDAFSKVMEFCGNLAKWCTALEKCSVIKKEVVPIQKELDEMNIKLAAAQGELKKKNDELQEVQAKVQALKDEF